MGRGGDVHVSGDRIVHSIADIRGSVVSGCCSVFECCSVFGCCSVFEGGAVFEDEGASLGGAKGGEASDVIVIRRTESYVVQKTCHIQCFGIERISIEFGEGNSEPPARCRPAMGVGNVRIAAQHKETK